MEVVGGQSKEDRMQSLGSRAASEYCIRQSDWQIAGGQRAEQSREQTYDRWQRAGKRRGKSRERAEGGSLREPESRFFERFHPEKSE
jgi:hypothetical protein